MKRLSPGRAEAATAFVVPDLIRDRWRFFATTRRSASGPGASPGRRLVAAASATIFLALSGCVAPTGPVEVIRFHAPEAPLGRGGIAVEPAPGERADMEFRSYAAAIARQLIAKGYSEQPGSSEQVALLRLERRIYKPERRRGPVSVGLGGGTGSYGSGLGVGIGIDLSGPPPEQIETEIFVQIKNRTSGQNLWEGRASFVVSAKSPLADTTLGAAKLADALFRDFPGRSGETILVK